MPQRGGRTTAMPHRGGRNHGNATLSWLGDRPGTRGASRRHASRATGGSLVSATLPSSVNVPVSAASSASSNGSVSGNSSTSASSSPSTGGSLISVSTPGSVNVNGSGAVNVPVSALSNNSTNG